MAYFNFNLRKKKSTSTTPINLIVRWDGKKLMYSTKEMIEPSLFEMNPAKKNFQRSKEIRDRGDLYELNARLDWIETTAKATFRKLVNDNGGRSPNVEDLKHQLDISLRNAKERDKIGLFAFFEKFIGELKTRFNNGTGKPIAKGTIVAYNGTLNILRDYATWSKSKIDFEDITLEFYQQFVEYLTREKNLSWNTTGRHIKALKALLSEATERGMNQNYAFRSKKFKKITEEVDNIYLNEEELTAIYNLDLSGNKRLEKVRDLFLVGCWTGLRFSDFTKISDQSINDNYLKIKAQKTGKVVIIPLHKVVKEIREKYKGLYPNSLPPAISNVKMNHYIKEVCKMVPSLHEEVTFSCSKGGVKTKIYKKKYQAVVTHTARRSFASNLYKDGVNAITIMRITGHKTERAFLTYIKVTPDEHAKLLKDHWEKKHQTQSV